jgi:hypothetical protein
LKGLYQTANTNQVLFLKSKLLSIKMEENENVTNFISRIKYLKDNLGDIGEKVSPTDLVTVTLNGMLEDYQMFITGIATRENAPTFEELAGILLQEEECRSHLTGKTPHSDLALMAKGKGKPWECNKGKPWERNKGGKPQYAKEHKGMTSPRSHTNQRKSDSC